MDEQNDLQIEDQIITPTLLAAAGVNVPEDEIVDLILEANDELDERIGEQITESLDDKQLKELVDLEENGTDEQVAAWLDKNVADLQQIIEDERDILIGEIAEDAKNIADTDATEEATTE